MAIAEGGAQMAKWIASGEVVTLGGHTTYVNRYVNYVAAAPDGHAIDVRPVPWKAYVPTLVTPSERQRSRIGGAQYLPLLDEPG